MFVSVRKYSGTFGANGIPVVSATSFGEGTATITDLLPNKISVCDFGNPARIYQNIRWFNISVNDGVSMNELNTLFLRMIAVVAWTALVLVFRDTLALNLEETGDRVGTGDTGVYIGRASSYLASERAAFDVISALHHFVGRQLSIRTNPLHVFEPEIVQNCRTLRLSVESYAFVIVAGNFLPEHLKFISCILSAANHSATPVHAFGLGLEGKHPSFLQMSHFLHVQRTISDNFHNVKGGFSSEYAAKLYLGNSAELKNVDTMCHSSVASFFRTGRSTPFQSQGRKACDGGIVSLVVGGPFMSTVLLANFVNLATYLFNAPREGFCINIFTIDGADRQYLEPFVHEEKLHRWSTGREGKVRLELRVLDSQSSLALLSESAILVTTRTEAATLATAVGTPIVLVNCRSGTVDGADFQYEAWSQVASMITVEAHDDLATTFEAQWKQRIHVNRSERVRVREECVHRHVAELVQTFDTTVDISTVHRLADTVLLRGPYVDEIRGLYLGWLRAKNVGDDVLYALAGSLFMEASLHGPAALLQPHYPPISCEMYGLHLDSYDFVVLGGGTILQAEEYACVLKEAIQNEKPIFAFGTGWARKDLSETDGDIVGVWANAVQARQRLYINAVGDTLSHVARHAWGLVRGPISKTAVGVASNGHRLDSAGDPGILAGRYIMFEKWDRLRYILGRIKSARREVMAINVGFNSHSSWPGGHDLFRHALVDFISHIVAASTKYEIILFAMQLSDTSELGITFSAIEAKLESIGAQQYLGKVHMIWPILDAPGTLALLQSADVSVCYKLHGAILSAAVGTPTIPLAYHPKYYDWFLSMGLSPSHIVRTDLFSANMTLLVAALERMEHLEAEWRETYAKQADNSQEIFTRTIQDFVASLSVGEPHALRDGFEDERHVQKRTGDGIGTNVQWHSCEAPAVPDEFKLSDDSDGDSIFNSLKSRRVPVVFRSAVPWKELERWSPGSILRHPDLQGETVIDVETSAAPNFMYFDIGNENLMHDDSFHLQRHLRMPLSQLINVSAWNNSEGLPFLVGEEDLSISANIFLGSTGAQSYEDLLAIPLPFESFWTENELCTAMRQWIHLLLNLWKWDVRIFQKDLLGRFADHGSDAEPTGVEYELIGSVCVRVGSNIDIDYLNEFRASNTGHFQKRAQRLAAATEKLRQDVIYILLMDYVETLIWNILGSTAKIVKFAQSCLIPQ
eukprot:g2436.t1